MLSTGAGAFFLAAATTSARSLDTTDGMECIVRISSVAFMAVLVSSTTTSCMHQVLCQVQSHMKHPILDYKISVQSLSSGTLAMMVIVNGAILWSTLAALKV